MPLSSVPLADLNSSNTFIMTTMNDGTGLDTDRMMITARGGEGEDSQDKLI
jgi:hypothetical protein